MTDPIEQAWEPIDELTTADGRVWQDMNDPHPFGNAAIRVPHALTQAILRYHPDVMRLVDAARAVKGDRPSAHTDRVWEQLNAALVPFTTEEEPE